MTITHQKLTFSEYLNYQDNTDNSYELVEGELIPMSLGTGKHGAIAKRLERFFDDEITRLKLPWIAQRFSVGLRSLCIEKQFVIKNAIALLTDEEKCDRLVFKYQELN